MKRTNLPALFAAILLISLLLAACGGTPVETSSPGPAPLAVIDTQGRIIEFDTPPQRIVVAGKSSLTIVNTLYLFPEAAGRLVGLVVGKQNPGDFLSLLDAGFDEKAILAVDAGPEQIAPLKPDVVVMRSFMADSLGQSLGEIDIPVVYVDLETPEQYLSDVATLGQLLDNEARSAEIVSFYQSRLDLLREAAPEVGPNGAQAPTTLLAQYTDQGGEVALSLPSTRWIQTMQTQLAGGVPVWAEAAQGGGWTVVNFEQIAAWDPETIVIISYGPDPSAIVAELRADARWQALGAVQAGRIYGYAGDYYSWDQPDPRWILGATWLAGKLNPDGFPSLDMVQEMTDFYTQMYGLDEAAVQEFVLPKLRGDVP